MNLEFTINWGYQMLYSRRLYHDVFDWSGCLECSDQNAVMELALLEYPFCMFGICYSPDLSKIEGNSWDNVKTRRSLGGLSVKVSCEENSFFTLKNKYGKFEFSCEDICKCGFKVFPVGGKYDFAIITVTRQNYYWFQNFESSASRIVFSASDISTGELAEKRRLLMRKLSPLATIELPVDIPKCDNRTNLLKVQIQGMLLKDLNKNNPIEPYAEEKENLRWVLSKNCIEDFVADEVTFRLEFSDGTIQKVKHYCRFHDFEVQLLEDIFVEIPFSKTLKFIKITNENCLYDFWINKVILEAVNLTHLQTELPSWVLKDKVNIGRIFAEYDCVAEIINGSQKKSLPCKKGWNEFKFAIDLPQVNYPLTITDGRKSFTAYVGAVYDLAEETHHVMVGADLTTVPHDDNGDMDRILSYMSQTQMGNTVVFRNFRPYPVAPLPEKKLLKKWGEYCCEHQIYVQSVNCHEDDSLYEGAGEFMHNCGPHEFAGVIYAGDPDSNNGSATMKEAAERYIDFVRKNVELNKKNYCRYGYGDAGGGARYLFMGKLEYIRAETMVPHTQHLCSLVRCASKVFGQGDWGVHIAIQHASQPYMKDWHLGKYFLSLYQPWAMGASNIYEEDSLFTLFKEAQQGWDDCLTSQKREMTRKFYKFASTRLRKGRLVINIASLEGRYAAPFNGFVCGSEQDPSYSVWGAFGNNSPEWGHNQVEKMRHLLDVLMPGASVHPLRQIQEKRRFYFSGTPYGDFDQLPIEAEVKNWVDYKLIMNLGWHSANESDMQKIRLFTEQGGVYFAGLPQYSQHLGREFLRGMEDFNLLNNGDLSDFCGIKVLKKSDKIYSGKYSGISGDESSSRTYSFSPDEDGKCYLAEVELAPTAEIVVKDAENNLPLIVKNRYGKGIVYTLCAWAYPGHENLAKVLAVFLRKLCAENRGEVYIEDESKELFWNLRDCGNYKVVTVLNTDWTTAKNRKIFSLHTPAAVYNLEVCEGEIKILYLYNNFLFETDGEVYLDIKENGAIFAHGENAPSIKIHKSNGIKTETLDFSNRTVVELQLN